MVEIMRRVDRKVAPRINAGVEPRCKWSFGDCPFLTNVVVDNYTYVAVTTGIERGLTEAALGEHDVSRGVTCRAC